MVEHLELRKEGWWQEALRRYLRHELFTHGPIDRSQLISRTSVALNATSDKYQVASVLESLIHEHEVFEREGKLHLSEMTAESLSSLSLKINDRERACADKLRAITQAHAVQYPPTWEAFRDGLLLPLTRELGARTHSLLRGDASPVDTAATSAYIASLPETDRNPMKQSALSFLDPTDPDIRALIMGMLNHYFLVSSNSVDREVLDGLSAVQSTRPTFNVLIDTNVIFSFLRLHKNPMNEATAALLSLTEEVATYVQVNFLALATTIEEARNALRGAKSAAPRGNVTSGLARSGVATGHISGLVGQYLESAAHDRALGPDSYFDPYITGLEAILEGLGIAILNDETDHIRQRKRVKDKVDDWYSFEFDRIEGRTRERIEHDVVALEVVSDKRGGRVSNLSEAGWWFVTVDLWLQRQEGRDLGGTRAIPRSINPAELVQVLRFWIPQDAAAEQALLGAMRLPFSFYDYDRKTERAVLQILDRLSGYTNLSSLGELTLTKVLSNDVLIARMANNDTGTSADELVDHAFRQAVEDNSSELAELRRANTEMGSRLRDLERTQKRNAEIKAGSDTNKRKLMEQREAAERELEKARRLREKDVAAHKKKVEVLEDTISQLSQEVSALKQATLRSDLRRRIGMFWIGVALLLVLEVWILRLCFSRFALGFWVRLAIGMGAAAIWFLLGLPLLHVLGLRTTKIGGLWTTAYKQLWGWICAGVVAAILTFTMAPPPTS